MTSEISTEPDVELSLPARVESVAIIRQAVSGIADVEGWTDPFLTDLKVAVSEACTNVVVHAYGDGEIGPITMSAWREPGGFRVRIVDRGRGITPRVTSDAPGLGLGLPLMATLASEVTVRSTPGGSTEVEMLFAHPNDRPHT